MYEEASAEDLIAIFTDTVVRYQKKPVYISSISAAKKLTVYDLSDMKVKIGLVDVNSEEFDFTPVPLGFCNHNKDALFLQRIPKRQYKQGLCKTNISVARITNDVDADNIQQVKGIRVRSLSHCIDGKYPSLENALKLIVEEGYRSVAFARKLAIDANLKLFFKNQQVGVVEEETGKFILNRTMKYLERTIHACHS